MDEGEDIFGEIGNIHNRIQAHRTELDNITKNLALSRDPQADIDRITTLEKYISHLESRIYKKNHPISTPPTPPKTLTPAEQKMAQQYLLDNLSRERFKPLLPKLPKPIQIPVGTLLGLGSTAGTTTAGGMIGGTGGGISIGIIGSGGFGGAATGIITIAAIVVGGSLKAEAQTNSVPDPKMNHYIEYVGKWLDYARTELERNGGNIKSIKMIKTFTQWKQNPGI